MFYPGSRIRIREFFHPGSYVLCKKGVSKEYLFCIAAYGFRRTGKFSIVARFQQGSEDNVKKISPKKGTGSGIRKKFIPDPDPGG
jgi:hypothetical protein